MASAGINAYIFPTPLPKLIVFDLDYTLWPFYADCMQEDQYVADGLGKVRGKKYNNKLHLYNETMRVLEIAKETKIPLAVASRSDDPPMANAMVKAFGLDNLFAYKEIYPGDKSNHFKEFKKASGIEYKKMLFFDDENRNITSVSRLGVTCILVPNGITEKIFINALKLFAKK